MLSHSSPVVHVPGVNDMQSPSPAGQSMSQISRQLSQSQAAWAGSRPPFPGQVRALRTARPPVPVGGAAPGGDFPGCWPWGWLSTPSWTPSWVSRSAGRGGSWLHGARPRRQKPGAQGHGSHGGDSSRTCPQHPGPRSQSSCARPGWPGPRPVPSQPGGPRRVLRAQSSMSPCHHPVGDSDRPAAGAGPAPHLSPVLIAANPFSVQQDAVDPVWDWDEPQLPGRPLVLQPAVQPGHLLAQRERLLRPGQQDARVR